MLTVDAIVVWPRQCDYPLWRQELSVYALGSGLRIAFSNHHADEDYRDFVADQLPHADCFDAPEGDGDWRDRAVNAALDRSDAERVWFTEQDLLIAEPKSFWGICSLPAAGWREAGSERWHPSCLIADRALVDDTSRYFGPEPVDHFATFGRELEQQARWVTDLGRLFSFGGFLERGTADVTHMAGLSSNHRLISDGRYDEVYKPAELVVYFRACLDSGAALAPGWAERANEWLEWWSSLPRLRLAGPA